MTKSQVRLAQAAMRNQATQINELCEELGVKKASLYRYVGPKGELRDYGSRVLAS